MSSKKHQNVAAVNEAAAAADAAIENAPVVTPETAPAPVAAAAEATPAVTAPVAAPVITDPAAALEIILNAAAEHDMTAKEGWVSVVFVKAGVKVHGNYPDAPALIIGDPAVAKELLEDTIDHVAWGAKRTGYRRNPWKHAQEAFEAKGLALANRMTARQRKAAAETPAAPAEVNEAANAAAEALTVAADASAPVEVVLPVAAEVIA